MMEVLKMLMIAMRRNKLKIKLLAMILLRLAIASSVPLLSSGVHALETAKRKQCFLICLVPVGLYLSTTSTPPPPPTTTTARQPPQPPTTTTSRITRLYDVGNEGVDDDYETRKLEDGEVSWLGGRMGK